MTGELTGERGGSSGRRGRPKQEIAGRRSVDFENVVPRLMAMLEWPGVRARVVLEGTERDVSH